MYFDTVKLTGCSKEKEVKKVGKKKEKKVMTAAEAKTVEQVSAASGSHTTGSGHCNTKKETLQGQGRRKN